MKICFYTPFKPLSHAHPSGDLVTASGIFNYFEQREHQVIAVSDLRCRWIYWKPWLWPKVLQETRQVVRQYSDKGMDLWLTYHSYYKAPDLLGPPVSKKMGIPYVIFQGIYSTKRRRNWKTRPGFYLNKHSLGAARHVFTNKKVDLLNIKRLIPENRITYIAPGLIPDEFSFDAEARAHLRRMLNVGDEPVVFSAAMFRQDVKTEGLTWVIRACGELYRRGYPLWLVIAGDGKEKHKLQKLAGEHLPQRARFVGKVARNEMYRFYSAGDVFVFPGIRESLGMVFLEAQSCGLPVVAFENAGVPEAVQDGNTGFLVPMYVMEDFVQAIERLLTNKNLRQEMGEQARNYVRKYHDLNNNYRKLEIVLQKIHRSSI